MSQKDESRLEYIKKLVYGKLRDKTVDMDYVTLAPLVFGVELSECECRKRLYGVYNFLQQVEQELEMSIEDKAVLDKITIEKLELEKERKKNQTINLEINKNLRRFARNELTKDKIKECINNLEPLIVPPLSLYPPSDREAILPISDIHYGKKCEIKGLKGEVINRYNVEVFEQRMWNLLSRVTEIATKEKIDKINLLLTGDLIDGILRMTQLQKLQHGIIDSTINLAEFLSVWINELSVVVKVDLYSCLGNHSQIRPLGTGNGDFAEENMEKVIMWFISSRLENNENVEIHENSSDFIYFNCKGLNIMASHGEERNIENAIKDYLVLYGEPIDMFIGGHLHTKENKSIGISHNGLTDLEYCRVKSICGIDEYSTRLRRSSGAGTSIFIVEEGKGKTTTYDINLQ